MGTYGLVLLANMYKAVGEMPRGTAQLESSDPLPLALAKIQVRVKFGSNNSGKKLMFDI